MLLHRLRSTAAAALALLLVAATPALASSRFANPPDSSAFKNTGIVRSIDLGGATTAVSTTYQITPERDGATVYFIALSEQDALRTTWMEAKFKGSQTQLEVKPWGPGDHAELYTVTFPKPLQAQETVTFTLLTLQSRASIPLPATVGQNEPQALVYNADLYVLSIYPTDRMRVKLKSPRELHTYTDGTHLTQYAESKAAIIASQGSVVTYGPFINLPPSAEVRFITEDQRPVRVHYEYDAPLVTIPQLKRSAEVSHWGANLNIQDELWVRNDGPKLKGFFSRLEHIKQNVNPQLAQSHILRNLVLHLPSGVRDPYYYDVIGNVSTSVFRGANPRRSQGKRFSPLDRTSTLELKPRYPLLGGWNYTFTMGYDMPLEDWVGYDAQKGAYVVAVPFLTSVAGAAYDDVELKLVLPEGAKILDIQTPFALDKPEIKNHVTYLDSVGRPSIIFKKKNATDKHNGLIYVTYTVSTWAQYTKPFVVATAFFGIFAFAMALRRVDFSIRTSKKKLS